MPQRLSVPKIDLNQLPNQDQRPEDTHTDSGSGRSTGSGRTEGTPSPSYQQRLLERRPSTPCPSPVEFDPKELDFKQPHPSCACNSPAIVKRLVRVKSRGAVKDDRDGFIYILRNPRDAKHPYYKLCVSPVQLTDGDVAPLVKECKFLVARYMYAADFLPLLLDSMAVLRYPLDNDPQTYHTYHKATGQLVADTMHIMASGKLRFLSKPESSWFMINIDVLQRLVQQTVAIIKEL